MSVTVTPLSPAVGAEVSGVALASLSPPARFPIGKVLACDYAPVADVAGMRVYRRVAPRCAR